MTIQPAHFQADDPESGLLLRLHACLERSRANGPGLRTVIWFQGCTLGCPGCFNPDTHLPEPKFSLRVGALLSRLQASTPDVEGITVSGGEPFQQPEGLHALLAGVRQTTALSVLVFSGYSEREIRRMALGPAILTLIDVLIDGRFVSGLRPATGLRGSSNQNFRLLTTRYELRDLMSVPAGEIRVGTNGEAVASGIKPLRLIELESSLDASAVLQRD